MTDLQAFEDWMYEKFARTTVLDTVRKIRFLARNADLESRESIMQFLRDQRRSGASKEKINGYVKYLNRWIEFKRPSGGEGWDKIIYLKTQRRSFMVKYYDASQIEILLERSRGTSVEDKRDHAMVMLALNTGLRRAEITGLKVTDIHQDIVTVWKGKGEKDRQVYLDPGTRAVVLEYARVRNNQESVFLFTTRTGVVDAEYMGKIAARISRRTEMKFSWHKCRHTYAKNMIRNDVDLETLRQMLGHEKLGTTGIYSVLDTGEAIERIRDKHPKFYGKDSGYKSGKPREWSHGLEGI